MNQTELPFCFHYISQSDILLLEVIFGCLFLLTNQLQVSYQFCWHHFLYSRKTCYLYKSTYKSLYVCTSCSCLLPFFVATKKVDSGNQEPLGQTDKFLWGTYEWFKSEFLAFTSFYSYIQNVYSVHCITVWCDCPRWNVWPAFSDLFTLYTPLS